MGKIYNGSSGPRDMDTMATRHLWNALSKMQRDEPHRTQDIADLSEAFEARDDKEEFRK